MAEEEGPSGSELNERGLPPIHRIKMPETSVMSTKIRWLHQLGYEVKEIHNFLGVRYQQVRNVVTTQPKRAAREDLPPLVIEILEITDDNLELMDQHAMEMSMAQQRNDARKAQKATNRARRKLREGEGNEALDDENYNEEEDHG